MARWDVIEGDGYKIYVGDIVRWAREFAWLYEHYDLLFHGSLGDWTYNLESILKRFGKPGSAPPKPGTDGSFGRQARGFMNQEWDTDVGYRVETWEALAPLFYPGAFTTSFSHPRTQHKMATAQENAGYLINPAFYDYHRQRFIEVPAQLGWIYGSGKPYGNNTARMLESRNADQELVDTWEGWGYGSPLCPELEPIIVAQKPYEDKPLNDITGTGAGALNILNGKNGKAGARWPGHVTLQHHPGCVQVGTKEIKNKYRDVPDVMAVYECHPDCPLADVDERFGPDKVRYFRSNDWRYEVAEALASADPLFYAPKVSKLERNAFCEELPLKTRHRVNGGGLAREPRFAPTQQHNEHPTLKSIALCKWIAELLLPPARYAPRRILVPCSGTGSEMIGCMLAGWEEVVGVELKPNYAHTAGVRLAGWREQIRQGETDPAVILAKWQLAKKGFGKKKTRKRKNTQMELTI